MSGYKTAMDVCKWFMGRGIAFSMRLVGEEMRYYPESGFYKSDGLAYLFDSDGLPMLMTRYQTLTPVSSPLDVILESKGWHNYSEDRFDGWKEPHHHWVPLYALLAANPAPGGEAVGVKP